MTKLINGAEIDRSMGIDAWLEVTPGNCLTCSLLCVVKLSLMCWVAEERMHLAKRMIGKVETAEIIGRLCG